MGDEKENKIHVIELFTIVKDGRHLRCFASEEKAKLIVKAGGGSFEVSKILFEFHEDDIYSIVEDIGLVEKIHNDAIERMAGEYDYMQAVREDKGSR